VTWFPSSPSHITLSRRNKQQTHRTESPTHYNLQHRVGDIFIEHPNPLATTTSILILFLLLLLYDVDWWVSDSRRSRSNRRRSPLWASCPRAAWLRSWPTWTLPRFASSPRSIAPSAALPPRISSGSPSCRLITPSSSAASSPISPLIWGRGGFTPGFADSILLMTAPR